MRSPPHFPRERLDECGSFFNRVVVGNPPPDQPTPASSYDSATDTDTDNQTDATSAGTKAGGDVGLGVGLGVGSAADASATASVSAGGLGESPMKKQFDLTLLKISELVCG